TGWTIAACCEPAAVTAGAEGSMAVKRTAARKVGASQKKSPVPASSEPVRRSKFLELGAPATRPLKAYAFDPSQGTLLGNQMELAVRYEDLDPGPVVRDS